MLVEKFVHAVNGPINGSLVQATGLCFVGFGLEFDLELIGVLAGVIMAAIGLIITWKSARLQKKVHLKELETYEIEQEIMRKEHPELFKDALQRRK